MTDGGAYVGICVGNTFHCAKVSFKTVLDILNEEVRYERKPKREWSAWEHDSQILIGAIAYSLYVRTDGKHVEVRAKDLYTGKLIKARASCHPNDEFDKNIGIKLAKFRLWAKLWDNHAKHFAGRL